MEKKTIGRFISALRKANGMTQKDLAERLNVSDKTVSRWECDEGAPDLSLIPVIAEIFGVSCDELLRGERRSPEAREAPTTEPEPSPKAEKQRRRILRAAMLQYQTRTYIAMGISSAGLIAAFICNLAFLRAVLGFLVGTVFFAAGIVCQSIFLHRALFSVEEEEFADMPEVNGFRRTALRLAALSFGLTAALVGFTFPLAWLDAYVGLNAGHMLLLGLIGAAAFLAVYGVVLWFVIPQLVKRGVYTLDEKETAAFRANRRLQKYCAAAYAGLLVITCIAHQFATSIWGPYSIMEGVTFEDFDSFAAYMEQDIPYEHRYISGSGSSAVETVAEPAPDEAVRYYDEAGNEISEEDARRRTLTDRDGNVLCAYIQRNEMVCTIRYGMDVLPITVCTYDDLAEARQTAAVRNVIFVCAYVFEAAAVVLVYLRKRVK